MVLAELKARRRKHIMIQRGNKELLTAQTYTENIKIYFVQTDALWNFAKVL